ncbi:protein LBH-like isoform X2 [Dicentrarchus labrax]|uniref:protein LBH-like isoform X2 n=1 Tax=Dicentrarchus labrax TaxID=13489 RepID=UPI0021F549AB|nr:protein LBH-like isoform X2 [Dicentrarchus labrax]
MNTCDSTVGGASGEDFQVFNDSSERFPKLSRRLPSIVVEPTDGGEVESGELRWPPDDVSSDVTEGHPQVTGVLVEQAEPQEQVMGGV